MNWTAKIFAYCERGSDPAFWAEPLNAASNAAFIIAAAIAFVIWARQPGVDRRIVDAVLIALVVVIGTGSFLFHTYATKWAAFADTIPIGIFMVSYVAYALRKFVGLGWLVTLGVLVLFFIALWQSSVFRCGDGPCFNGSLAYAPAFVMLVGIGLYLGLKRHPAAVSLVAGGLIFAASLAFRTLDQDICPMTAITAVGRGPLGTHFIWHCLNGLLLFLLLRAAILFGGGLRTAPPIAKRG